MLKTVSEEELQQYVWLHADETLRKIQAGILEQYGENKSLQWISKEKKAYEAEKEDITVPLPEVTVDDPEITKLKTDITKVELQKKLAVTKKQLILEKAEVERAQYLVDVIDNLRDHTRLLTRKLEQEYEQKYNLINGRCPKCKGKFLIEHSSDVAKCLVCNKKWRYD